LQAHHGDAVSGGTPDGTVPATAVTEIKRIRQLLIFRPTKHQMTQSVSTYAPAQSFVVHAGENRIDIIYHSTISGTGSLDHFLVSSLVRGWQCKDLETEKSLKGLNPVYNALLKLELGSKEVRLDPDAPLWPELRCRMPGSCPRVWDSFPATRQHQWPVVSACQCLSTKDDDSDVLAMHSLD